MLYEIISIVNQLGERPENLSKQDNAARLLAYIIAGEVRSDGEGMEKLSCSRQYYYQIKNTLYRRIVNNYIAIDWPQDTISNRYLFFYKELALIKFLRTKGKPKLAVYLAEKILPKVIDHQQSEIVLALLRLLVIYYATFEKQPKKLQRYQEQLDYYREAVSREAQMELLFSRLASEFIDRVEIREQDHQRASQIVEEAEEVATGYPLYRIQYFKYYIKCYAAELQNDLATVSESSQAALQFFSGFDLKKFPYVTQSSFFFRMIPALIKLSRFQEAQLNIQKAEALIPNNSRTYFLLQIYKVLSHTYQRQFKTAAEVVLQIKRRHLQSDTDQELYLICKAYTHLLAGKPIQIGRILNDISRYSKDKSGMNINVITIELLNYIDKGKTSRYIDRIDAIRSYMHDHLRKNEHYRSQLWLRFLTRVAQANFHPEALKRKAAEEIAQLEGHPIRQFRKGIDEEPVPFEELVGFVVRALG